MRESPYRTAVTLVSLGPDRHHDSSGRRGSHFFLPPGGALEHAANLSRGRRGRRRVMPAAAAGAALGTACTALPGMHGAASAQGILLSKFYNCSISIIVFLNAGAVSVSLFF